MSAIGEFPAREVDHRFPAVFGLRQRFVGLLFLFLGALGVLAYWRSAELPFISDDYIQIWLGRLFGPVSGWKEVALDPLYRCRATSLVLTYWTDRLFGLDPTVYRWSSILLHAVNTWLVFALGVWRPIGWRISAVAAAFFAVYEGHQEAVIWYAALPELLVFLFSVSAFLAWVLWIQQGRKGFGALTLGLFLLALLSKESAVVLVALMLLPVWWERAERRKWLKFWIVAILMAAAYTGLVFAGSSKHLFFHDGTFSLAGPFWITIPRSMFRLFWIWGTLAAAALAVCGLLRRQAGLVLLSVLWAALTLIPYSFLTYMPFVPSRHTYLASVGVAMMAGAAAVAVLERVRHKGLVAAAMLVVVAGTNCSYIWIRKHRQFAERAAPTEQLLHFARQSRDPVWVHCYPYGFDSAEWAVQLMVGKHVRRLEDADAPRSSGEVFCYPPHRFPNRIGAVVPASGGFAGGGQ